ncbi:UDP-N-acetylmuramoyl-L-alanine--D-glutamate ligase [Salaquimonas pukyongi]|uniref:UDP-N-acetylmuramoyl-L-alanine--D-glutamate ligase n=1 Tax=Salaquimonas pukyongi TaxID=2712698 RepID=UPI00096BCE3D|nr:UDP-N-acetylmuramoyl-L-alanine--D-glutamate ligase [Salaquimonas pukyongi]
MIAANTEKGKRIALFGLGGSGLVTARSLLAGGADLVCFDDNPASVEAAAGEGLPTGDLREVDFSSVDELVLAPGVPLTHPKPHWTVEMAREAGKPVIGDVELFCRERREKCPQSVFAGITGTNGKSTTTALVSHVFAAAGRDVQMGGNIGRAVLSLDEPAPDKVYVVECSSYQIDLAPTLDPSVGILLNLSPDHLDRHGTMENYAAIKKRLVANSATAITGVDDEFTAAIAGELKAAGRSVVTISAKGPLDDGIFFDDGRLWRAGAGKPEQLFDMAEAPALRGSHNGQNAAAAWAAGECGGLSAEQICRGLTSFPGLIHRMEPVGRCNGVLFVNDSKGTNADAAARALSSYHNIFWIAGGLAKEGGIEPLQPYFGRIEKAYLVGEAAPQFAATLGAAVAFEISGTIEQAVASAAAAAAQSGLDEPVVLLSPACASFDQFPNFEVRGEAFRQAAKSLKGFKAMKELTS